MGNLNAKRDWGHARDYVYAQWLMLHKTKPKDYVIASGETHTVREFVELAFKEIGIDIIWKGKDLDEIGIDSNTGNTLVKVDKNYFRPVEVEVLLGDPGLAKKDLKWSPNISFKQLVSSMVQYDLNNDNYGGKEFL